jgi:thioredoxin reductase
MGGFFVCIMSKNTPTQDLIIIGGGVMGLMTAYYASAFVNKITILEKRQLVAIIKMHHHLVSPDQFTKIISIRNIFH